MYTILIPVDFKESTATVLRYSETFLIGKDRRFVLVHGYSTMKRQEILVSIDDVIEKELNRKMDELCSKLRNTLGKRSEVICLCQKGDMMSALRTAAKFYMADIILFSLGPGEAIDFQNTKETYQEYKNLQRVGLPIIILPFEWQRRKTKDFHIALDSRTIDDEVEMQNLTDLVSKSNAQLHVLEVESLKEKSLADMHLSTNNKKFFKSAKISLKQEQSVDTELVLKAIREIQEIDLFCLPQSSAESIESRKVARNLMNLLLNRHIPLFVI